MNHQSDEISAKHGRPRDPERMRRVLEAAKTQFLQQGFTATSMESIAKAASVSKMTIYNYFPNKEVLFETCVATRTDAIFHLSTLYHTGQQLPLPNTLLHQIAIQFVVMMRDEEILALHRVMMACASQHPDICQSFFEQGCLRLNQQLQGYFELANQAKLLCIPNVQRAADQFLALFLGRQHLQGLLMLGTPTEAEDRAMIEDNLNLFLKGYPCDLID